MPCKICTDGQIIDYIRARLNGDYHLHHKRLEGEIGVAQSTISRIARGEVSPRLDTAQKLLDKFRDDDLTKKCGRAAR